MSNTPYTVYTYGGGEQLNLAFNAIAALFNHDVYLNAFYISAVLFGFWVLFTSVMKNQPMQPIKWLFWFWIATTMTLAPKTDVIISDPITKFERKVDNVPYILGAFSGVISSIGYHITDTVETFFKMPDYQRYGENGSVFASKILKNMNQYRIRDGRLQENMQRFINLCVKEESLMGGVYTIKELHEAKNIWELVRDNANPINGFSYRGEKTAGTEILSCKVGALRLDKDLRANAKVLATYMGKKYQPESGKTISDVAFEHFFNERLQNSYKFMSGIGESAENILQQEMMINAIEDAKNSYGIARAAVQQRFSNYVTGELASTVLVAMKIVLETLAYSSFIFIAIMMMLPTGFTILSKYLGILLWLQLWAPLYAVLNMVMSSIASLQTKAELGGDGLTLMNSIGLAGLQADIVSITALASSSIPFISYALLQGGAGAFMHLAGTMTSSMSGAAQGISGEIASGNLSMNNVSYAGRQQNMTTGFKHDTSLGYRASRLEMEKIDGAQSFVTPSGKLHTMSGEGINASKIPDKAAITQSISNAFNCSIAREESQAREHGQAYEQSRSHATDNAKSLLQSMGSNTGKTQSWGISESSRYADSINKTLAF